MSEATERTRLTLEKRHQLIDLNKEYVNFDIAFECRAVDATKDYEIIVVTQEQLNTIDLTNLTMKRTKGGYISGNIIADEDKYQNYFLIMRSATDDPTEVDLEIRIKPIEARQQPAQQPDTPPQAQTGSFTTTTNDDVVSGGGSKNNRSVWLALAFFIVVGAVGYYYYTRRRGGDGCSDNVAEDVRSVVSGASSSSSSEMSDVLEKLVQKQKTK